MAQWLPKLRRGTIAQLSAKQRLIEAGKKHFASVGFKGASVREIAVTAELAPNMINHHFGGKQALFDAIIEQFSTDSMSIPLRIIAEPATTTAEFELRFQLFITETFEIMIAHKEVFQIVSRENGVSLPLKEFRQGLNQFVENAHAAGLMRAEVDVSMVVGFVLDRLANQIIYSASLVGSENQNVTTNMDYRKHWLKSNIDLLLHGLV